MMRSTAVTQALLVDLARVGRDAPRHHAADVAEVRDVGRPGHELAVGEHGHGQDDVVEVRDAAVVGVVGHVDVALADARARVELEDPPHRLVEHADERGDPGAAGGELPVRVGDPRAHVEHLVDDRAHRGAPHRGEHLVGRGLQARLDDLQRDRVEVLAHPRAPTSMCRLP
jgi:hypothetical protein